MHISKVELENFKSHENAAFEFGRGTTAITGPNGAGKTSILEAIAWTVFDTLDYKKEDLVRRGCKKGSARVTFESGLDEREYVVYRDTATGYYVFDPQLKARIADKKEEVTRFLRQHLGAEPGTDLETLFRHAIGVPQGTFTAAFLCTPAERKRTFDSLLKVEEYRRSADELLKTARYVEQQVSAVDVKIARSEGEIARIDAIERERDSLAAKVKDLAGKLDSIQRDAAGKAELVGRLDELERRIAELNSAVERSRAAAANAELVMKHRSADLARSREAAETVERVREDAEAHQNALARLSEFERERIERDGLRNELAKTEAALHSVATERKHLGSDLERIQRARAEISELTALASEQSALEDDLSRKRVDLARAQAAVGQLVSLNARLAALRESYREAADRLAAARESSQGAAQIEKLQTRDSELVRELAAANAALERDERFQREIKNGLCPILSARCLNLQEGQTLEAFVSSQFGELRTRIEVLVSEQATVIDALRTAREAEKHKARISVLEDRVREIGDEGTRLKADHEALERDAAAGAGLAAEISSKEARLAALNNPKARMTLLQRDADREPVVREGISECERNLERLESDRRITVEKLESYKDLDALSAESIAMRDRTAAAYRDMVTNEPAALQLAVNEEAHLKAEKEYNSAADSARKDEAAARAAAADYDRNLHLTERAALAELQRELAETGALLRSAEQRRDELVVEAERLYEVRRSMQEEFRERERLKRIAETTDFIRSTLREAAPMVARNYVHHVSLEANHMFREVSGDAECTLKWTEDYGIVLEEAGHDRPFQSLSGGEQMAAALSVRLALLKQLSDIHIAFFDEPTTNMDAGRRENLAMQIGNIRHFDQLFVISHDDTFEGYMDHEVRVGDQ
jgi:DNA repair protein SbcC/Rad50